MPGPGRREDHGGPSGAPARVLVTGATGFVGSRVVAALLARPGGTPLRVLTHRTALAGDPTDAGRGASTSGGLEAAVTRRSLEVVTGDLAEPGSLRGLCEGVHTVLHLASRIGGDWRRCAEVNVHGTRALLAEARRAGVRRFVQLSTSAVYRDGVHRGAGEDGPELSPASVTGRTRLQAEREVLAADGVVLRPHLVVGPGDAWVAPALAELLTRLPAWIDGGRARVSVSTADCLARPLAALATTAWRPRPGGEVFHANHPVPVTVRELATWVAGAYGLPLPVRDVGYAEAARLLDTRRDRIWARRLSQFGVDHWYESGRLWRRTGLDPGPRALPRRAAQAGGPGGGGGGACP
ncbi:NAD-dependent epimerase/dehydratase family protein [Streptomyces sp. NPDC006743]|uniref:NAD-dependent epimerase/dehydratase family protein n=1 Tax=Streptomyces sp. NPDC006743 TaxID=3154480 RepID=UPI0034527F01